MQLKGKKPGCLQNAPPLYERKRGVFVASTVVVLISLYDTTYIFTADAPQMIDTLDLILE